jgi:hypothetical protein
MSETHLIAAILFMAKKLGHGWLSSRLWTKSRCTITSQNIPNILSIFDEITWTMLEEQTC